MLANPYAAYRDLVGQLRLSYSQFEELETFARFATRLDDDTRKSLERGKRLREILQQGRHQPFKDYEQIGIFSALINGLLDGLPLEMIKEAEKRIAEVMGGELPETAKKISSGEKLDDKDREAILALCRKIIPVTLEEQS